MLLWSASIALAVLVLIISSKLLRFAVTTINFLGPYAVLMAITVFIGLATIAYVIHGMLLVP